jgi:hypothetical protein
MDATVMASTANMAEPPLTMVPVSVLWRRSVSCWRQRYHAMRRMFTKACSPEENMPRRPRDQLFNRNDFNRLVDAARKKGLPIARIDAMRDGLSLVVGEPPKDGTVPEAEPTPLLQGGAGGR